MMKRAAIAIGLWTFFFAGAPPLNFVPLEPRFAEGTDEYRRLWETDGARIVAAMEGLTGLAFPAEPVEILVRDGPPMTAYDGRTIRLRARCSPGCKLGTFTHELGHRLALLLPRSGEIDDHRLLYLFLYDAWTDLYGQDFADRMVRIERRIPGAYDYDAAWSWALAMTREQRQARLRTLAAPARPALPYDAQVLSSAEPSLSVARRRKRGSPTESRLR
jgi:hypothetical protein